MTVYLFIVSIRFDLKLFNFSNSPTTSRSQSERRNSLENFPASSTTKRRHENSDGDSDHEAVQSKRSKKTSSSSAFDGLTTEAQEALVNQLVESVDDVSARIEKIMEANGLTARDLERRSLRLMDEPSTSRDRNGTHRSPSCSNTSDNQPGSSSATNNRTNMPSCSRTDTANASNGRERFPSNSSRSNTKDGAGRVDLSPNSNNLGRMLQAANPGSNNGAYERLDERLVNLKLYSK